MEDAGKGLLRKVADSVESFTVDFYKNVAAKTEGNFVTSGLSAHAVLAMAAYGARDNTAAQMKKALYLSDNDREACEGYRSFVDNLNNIPNVILRLGNKLYVRNDITTKEEFKKITEDYFHSKMEMMDVSNPDVTVGAVNKWCEELTNGKLKDILTAGDITGDLVLILLNTAYFKSNWKRQFNNDWTKPRPFYVSKRKTIKVPMMLTKEEVLHRFIHELDARSIKLPYKNEDLSLEIILPNKFGGLAQIQDNLEKINDNMTYQTYEISVLLPKFKIETTIDLTQHLSEMGMDEMFHDGLANFNGITDTPLSISKVRQKAFIEVNEEGSEAGVCSEVFLVLFSMDVKPEAFVADKPFLFRIMHKTSTLFIGRVTNPLSSHIDSSGDETSSCFNNFIFCK